MGWDDMVGMASTALGTWRVMRKYSRLEYQIKGHGQEAGLGAVRHRSVFLSATRPNLIPLGG